MTEGHFEALPSFVRTQVSLRDLNAAVRSLNAGLNANESRELCLEDLAVALPGGSSKALATALMRSGRVRSGRAGAGRGGVVYEVVA